MAQLFQTREFAGWREFKKECYNVQFHKNKCYRGQSNAGWALKPTYFRFHEDPDLDKYFDALLPEVARHISGYVDYRFNLDDQRDQHLLLGLLQHHGFPSPLLDWTRSPYIAAYFAFLDHAFKKPECDNVAVWSLTTNPVQETLIEENVSCPFEIVEPNSRFNPRLLAQDGLFTLSKEPKALEVSLGKAIERSGQADILMGGLQKWVIPVETANLALNDLHLMGVHHGTLFPGIDGACKSLKLQHFVPSDIELGPLNRARIDERIEKIENKRRNK